MRLWLAAGAIVALGACRKRAPGVTVEAGADVAIEAGAASTVQEVPPRCTVAEKTRLAAADAGDSFEFGEAARVGDGAVVGLLRAVSGHRVAAIARVSPHAAPRVVDLGVAESDDPPPQPFVRGAEVFAAAYVAEAKDAGGQAGPPHGRRLSVFRVTDAPERLVTVPQAADDSPAFDAVALPSDSGAGALLVWDESSPRGESRPADPPRGIIRAALLAADLRTVVQLSTLSPDLADAERPRVGLRDGGFWVAWIARRREPSRDAAPELEAPGEEPVFRWVELLALDAHAKPAGAVRRLTSASAHVAGFDVVAGPLRIDAAFALDDERPDGTAGEVSHVQAAVEGAPRTIAIRPSGAGRGTEPWLGWAPGRAGWLSYVDASDRVRLVPLDAEGAPTGPDSIEPLLDDARPVAAGAFGMGSLGLLAAGSGSEGTLRWLTCSGLP